MNKKKFLPNKLFYAIIGFSAFAITSIFTAISSGIWWLKNKPAAPPIVYEYNYIVEGTEEFDDKDTDPTKTYIRDELSKNKVDVQVDRERVTIGVRPDRFKNGYNWDTNPTSSPTPTGRGDR